GQAKRDAGDGGVARAAGDAAGAGGDQDRAAVLADHRAAAVLRRQGPGHLREARSRRRADLAGQPGLGRGGAGLRLGANRQANGVDYTKVNFVEVGFQQMADVLKGGSVDAVDAIDPYYDRVAAIGHSIGNPDEDAPPGTLTSVYAVTRQWATAHPDLVAAFRQ